MTSLMERPEKVRLIKIMFSDLEMVGTNKINNHIPIKRIKEINITTFSTFEHSNFLKFVFRKNSWQPCSNIYVILRNQNIADVNTTLQIPFISFSIL